MITRDRFLAHIVLTVDINRRESDFSQEQFIDFFILFLNLCVKKRMKSISANLMNCINKHSWWWSERSLAFQEFRFYSMQVILANICDTRTQECRPRADTYPISKILSLNDHWCFVLHCWCRSSKSTRRQDNQTRQLHFLE